MKHNRSRALKKKNPQMLAVANMAVARAKIQASAWCGVLGQASKQTWGLLTLKARFMGSPPFLTPLVIMAFSCVFTEDTVLQASVTVWGPRVPTVSSVLAFMYICSFGERNLS